MVVAGLTRRMEFVFLVAFCSFVVFALLESKVRRVCGPRCCGTRITRLPHFQQREWYEHIVSCIYRTIVPVLAIAYVAVWLSRFDGPFTRMTLVQRLAECDALPYLHYCLCSPLLHPSFRICVHLLCGALCVRTVVEIALGFIAEETRALTLNINAPMSAFLYHLAAFVLMAVAVWTRWGLPVALVLLAGDVATAVLDVAWLCSRTRWRGCCHLFFFVLFVPVFAVLRAACHAVAAVLAWSLLLYTTTAARPVAPWLAYAMMALLCAYLMAHAVWSCQMVAAAITDTTHHSTLAAAAKKHDDSDDYDDEDNSEDGYGAYFENDTEFVDPITNTRVTVHHV